MAQLVECPNKFGQRIRMRRSWAVLKATRHSRYASVLQKSNITNAGMAQLVEQRIRNAQVVGSSPTTSSKRKARKPHERIHADVYGLFSSLIQPD